MNKFLKFFKKDLSLYLVTDTKLSQPKTVFEVVEEAIAGGVSVVQLREKTTSTLEFYKKAKKLHNFLKVKKIPLIINDRIDIALAIDAEGVHLGQSDLPFENARKILGENKIIGITANHINHVINLKDKNLDYFGVSSIFPTKTKKVNNILGLENLSKIRKITNIPLVAIGGIKLNNVEEVMKTGVDGIAVISVICSSKNITSTTKKFKKIIKKYV